MPAGRTARGAAAPSLGDRPEADRRIDWESGDLYVFANGAPSPEAATVAARWQQALASAWSEAQGKLAQASGDVPWDALRRVSDVLGREGGRQAQRTWKAFLQEAEPVVVHYRADASVGLWLRAPLYGGNGLAGILDRRNLEREERQPAGQGEPAGTRGWLVLRLLPESSWSEALWPVLWLPGGEKYADLPRLSREGALPRDFSIRRVRAGDPLPNPVPSTRETEGWRALPHENRVDLILENSAPPAAFNAGAWRGIVVVEP